MEFRIFAFGTRCLSSSSSLSIPPSVLSSSRHDFSKQSRPLRLFDEARMDFLEFVKSLEFLRASGDFEPFEEQLACEPEPEFCVELLLSEELLLKVRIKGFLATGEIGGVEIRELMQDSESLSSVAVVVDFPIISDVRGGFTGGVVLPRSSSKLGLGDDGSAG
jgi:hypothetical protein